uniref:MFS domain-containing protein n=1 Tax=Parastrongyloides trichosuri TaxID=131310 RepID=A0A0N5A566_PARTI
MSNKNTMEETPNTLVIGSSNTTTSTSNKDHQVKGGLLSKMFPGKKRYIILCASIIGLCSLFSNILTFGFGITCMTEEKYHWEDFNVSLGIDIFEKIDFDSIETPDFTKINFSLPTTTTTQASILPDFKFEIKTPSIGFNKETFKIMTDHPEIFQKILKTIVVEGSKLALDVTGKALDPRKINWSNLVNGFNLTNFDPSVINQFKHYVTKQIESIRSFKQETNVTSLRPPKIDDIDIERVNWKGDVFGKIKIIDKLASFTFTDNEKHILLASAGFGVILFFYPMSLLLKKLGVRKTITMCCLLSAFIISLFPIVVKLDFYGIMITQILLGACFACTFPSFAAITECWATLNERVLFYSLLTLVFPLGAFIAYPLGGIYCSTIFGYEIIFESSCMLTLLTTIYFWVTYRNSPGESTLITVTEQRLIENGKPIDGRKKHNKTNVPVKNINLNSQFLLLVLLTFTTFSIYSIIFNVGPTYLISKFEHCPIFTGLLLSMYALVIFILSTLNSNKSELIGKDWDSTKRIKIITLISFIIAGCGLILTSLTDSINNYLPFIFIFIICISISFNTATFFRAIPEISREYLYYISTILQLSAGLGLIIVHFAFLLFGKLCCLYFIVGCLAIISAIASFILFKYKPGEFTISNSSSLPKGESELCKSIIKSEIEDTL